MTDGYRSLDEKPFDIHYLQEEIDIDSPPEKVWPHAVRIGQWMDAHVLETVDGKEGEVGHFERVKPRNIGAEVPLPHHHVYGVGHLIPNKLIVLEVLPERGGSYGSSRQYISFDSIHLVDLGNGKTRVIMSMIDAQLGKDPESAKERAALIDGAHDQIRGNLETLKRQSEA